MGTCAINFPADSLGKNLEERMRNAIEERGIKIIFCGHPYDYFGELQKHRMFYAFEFEGSDQDCFDAVCSTIDPLFK